MERDILFDAVRSASHPALDGAKPGQDVKDGPFVRSAALNFQVTEEVYSLTKKQRIEFK